MNKIIENEKHLIGLTLGSKTKNANGQAFNDCGALWQKFEKDKIHDSIPDKLNNEVMACYYNYDGDHDGPFAYFIGCEVNKQTETPKGLTRLIIPKGNYLKRVAKGKMPNCIGEAWNKIWESNLPRTFNVDFEVYGEKSYNWLNAEVDIFLSVE